MAGQEKIYHPGEERLNVVTHFAGLLLMLLCGVMLLARCGAAGESAAVLIYVISLVCVYASSGAYHWSSKKEIRAFLRLCDHAAIYLLIAGTYTPLMLLSVGGPAGITVLSVNWCLALLGVTFEIISCKPFRGFSIVLYIIMGWLCLAVAGRLVASLDFLQLIFLVVGGVAYTGGVVFYLSTWRYAHTLWHVFVLLGSLLQFISVWMIVVK